jgi:hypothetical protein
VLLDDLGKYLEQLFFTRVVGVVAEQLDAVVQAVVGEKERQSFEITVDSALVGGFSDGGHQAGIVEFGSLHTGDVLDGVLVILVEGLVPPDDFGVVQIAESAIEKGECDETGLDLVHS